MDATNWREYSRLSVETDTDFPAKSSTSSTGVHLPYEEVAVYGIWLQTRRLPNEAGAHPKAPLSVAIRSESWPE